MKINEYSAKEINSMLERGIIGKCSICGELAETEKRWPIHNMIICPRCKGIKERKEHERSKKVKYL